MLKLNTVLTVVLLAASALSQPLHFISWSNTDSGVTNLIFEVWHSTTVTNYDTNLFGGLVVTNPMSYLIVTQNYMLDQSNVINWTLLARTTDTNFSFQATNPYEFFRIRAVTYQTLDTSDWASKVLPLER